MLRLLKLAGRRDTMWRLATASSPCFFPRRLLSSAPSSATIFDRLGDGALASGTEGSAGSASSSSGSSSEGSAASKGRNIAAAPSHIPPSSIEEKTAKAGGSSGNMYTYSEYDEYKDAIESVLESSQFALRHAEEDTQKSEGLRDPRPSGSSSSSEVFHPPKANILNSVDDVAKMLIRQCSKSELIKVSKFLESLNKLSTKEKRIKKVLKKDQLPPHLNWFAHWLYTRALGLQLGDEEALAPFPFDSSDPTRDSIIKQSKDSLAEILMKFSARTGKKDDAVLSPAEELERADKARELSDTLSRTLPIDTLDDLMDMLSRRAENPQSRFPRPNVLFTQYFHTHPQGLDAFFHFMGIKISETHKRGEYWKMMEMEQATYTRYTASISEQLQHLLTASGAAVRVDSGAESVANEHRRSAFNSKSVLSVHVHCRLSHDDTIFSSDESSDIVSMNSESSVGSSYDSPQESINTYMKVFIDNLPIHTTKSDLRSSLARVGQVGRIWLFNEGVPDESNLSRSMRESYWRSGGAPDGQEAHLLGEEGGGSSSNGSDPFAVPGADETDEPSEDWRIAKSLSSSSDGFSSGARCRNLSKLRVVRNIRSDVCAFFEMEDEEGLNNALSPSLRVLGLCVSGDRLCRTKASSLSRKLWVEMGTDTTIADLPHSLQRLLGKGFHFDVKNGGSYDESSRPMFLELTFDDHDAAWHMHGVMHRMMEAGVPIKPCWIKTKYYWSMAERAVKSSYASDREDKVHGFESYSDFSEQMLFDINSRQKM